MIEVGTSVTVLQSALDHCRVDDIRTPEVYDALDFLEHRAVEKWPFNSAPRWTPEALWQILNASLNGIRRNIKL